MYYSDYLKLGDVLNAQELESDKQGKHAHDEMLFIVIHQSYELWFKQILFEMKSVYDILAKENINDNSPELQIAVNRMHRVTEILRILVDKINILETMSAQDFLDFRDMLRPASGFQSMQFKVLETLLGLKVEERHGQEYFTSQLRSEDAKQIYALAKETTLLELVNNWLERMPFFEEKYWGNEDFCTQYRNAYSSSLSEMEMQNLRAFDELFMSNEPVENRKLSAKARRAGLFIMLYRDYPILQNPYRIINSLLDIDELLATWRWRHMNMVHRMIGGRAGTGGSTGKGYLREAAMKHYVFQEFAELTSFLVERRKFPTISHELAKKLGFENG